MTMLDLRSPTPSNEHVNAAICVIGAGMVGLTLAMRLAKAGQKVVVLESGGESFDPAVHDLNQLDDVSGRYTRAMDGHYRGLGGSSTRWGGRMIPISIAETRRRDHVGLSAWPFPAEELLPYHRDIEDLFKVAGGSFDGPVNSHVDPKQSVPRDDPDFLARWAKWPKFRNCSLANLYGKQVRNNPNIELWLNATVTAFDVDRERGRVRTIVARSAAERQLHVQADHFVLAAGTIETTRLLLWLDANVSGRVFERSPVLGCYLQDHINARVARLQRKDSKFASSFCGYRFHKGTRRSLQLELSPAAQQDGGGASVFAYINMDVEGSSLQFAKNFGRSLQRGDTSLAHAANALRHIPVMSRMAWARYVEHRLYLPPDVDTFIELCAEQLPDDRNFIELSEERDAMGIPKARLHWRPMPADEVSLRNAADRLAAYWTRHGLDCSIPLDWTETCRNPNGTISEAAVDYAHPSGTVRMGTSRSSSVVNPHLVCHDLPNLSVVSAAVFPTAGSANPTFTLLAMAMRHADALLAAKFFSAAPRFRSVPKPRVELAFPAKSV